MTYPTMDETEKNTLEVDVLFGLLAIGVAARWLRKRWKRTASLKWPMVAATIVGRSAYWRPRRVRVCGFSVPISSAVAHIPVGALSLDFDYAVEGKLYRGAYEEEFRTVEQAERQIENYLSLPFYVRYNPSNHANYFVDPYRDIRDPKS
jgi:hypothetical protein